ncbi:MAG TPA: HD domain-containing phosphohydrolase [Gemmatimonadaceae bacterium]|nr:HD domain-containing phosphohydrolase [Gemmatimonadaceae bacterium]
MNRPTGSVVRPTQRFHVQGAKGGEGFVREAGRNLMLAIYGALRNLRLYPAENAVVQTALAELVRVAEELRSAEGELDFRVAGEFIFVNATRLRLDLDNYTTFSYLLSQFRGSGVGEFKVNAPTSARDWTLFLNFLLNPVGGTPAERFEQLQARFASTGVTVFEISPPVESEDDQKARSESREAAKRTYSQSVSATKDVMNSVRMGQTPNLKKVKRVVQGIVDQILSDEASLIGLTTIRDYDDYTFTHSVNVCIFSVALGRRVGLSRQQLYDLGLGALFHDIGKSRVPSEVINKPGQLNEDEWRMIASHPWMGVLALFQLREATEFPYRAMRVAYEHHMKRDVTGYPRSLRTKAMGLYSRIVMCADAFDAATSRRSYQTEPMDPASVLAELRDNARRGQDPVIVKAFVSLLGIYPVGTFVVLDTFELAIVHSINPDPALVSRPMVLIVSDDLGNVRYPGDLVSLGERDDAGNFRRTIIKTANPERYGIRVGDYFI